MKFIICFILVFLEFSYKPIKVPKYWDEGGLDIEDFNGDPPNSVSEFVAAEIAYDFEFDGNGKHTKIRTFMHKYKSWLKTSMLDSDQIASVLKHEQIHFDIAEVWARKERKIIKNTPNYNSNDFDNNGLRQCDKEQKWFDALSLGGDGREEQKLEKKVK